MPNAICLVAFFGHEAFYIPLSNIRKIFQAINPDAGSIVILDPALEDRIVFHSSQDIVVFYKKISNPVRRIIGYVLLNFRISWHIIRQSKHVKYYIFFMESGMPLPMLSAKLCQKKVIWVLPSSFRLMIKHKKAYINLLLVPFETLLFSLTDNIVLYSHNLEKEWNLEKYNSKVRIAHEHLINTQIFTETIPLSERPYSIGYIGRLSEEKGIKNLVLALPQILNENKEISAIIGGDGELKEEIMSDLHQADLSKQVNIPGWISREELPRYLNQIKLLILPSFTEGLPNILLEAMACGTPVLATPVGAIPDIIKESETGFIMENNSPECIVKNIQRVLVSPNLETVSSNAKQIILQEFTPENAVGQWKDFIHI